MTTPDPHADFLATNRQRYAELAGLLRELGAPTELCAKFTRKAKRSDAYTENTLTLRELEALADAWFRSLERQARAHRAELERRRQAAQQ